MTNRKDKPKRYRNLKPAWKPGQAGNPQGRPPRDVQQRELISQLADHGDEALATVIAVMRKARASGGDAVKLRAAQDVLDKLLGRAPQSLAASIVQRSIAHDGTLIEGSAIGAISPLLQAAHAHFAEEEMRQLAAPKTEPAPERSPPPRLPLSRYLINPSCRLNPPPPGEDPTGGPPLLQIPEVPDRLQRRPHRNHRVLAYLPTPLPSWALKAKEREGHSRKNGGSPGGQIPAKDWFQPDPLQKKKKAPQRSSALTRIPGGRGIRRV